MKNLNYKSPLFIFAAFFAISIIFSGCADVALVDECLEADPYGFWGGLWHGMTSAISFIGSLFYEDIAVYAVNNSGGWYDFGFVLGAGILGGSVTSTTSK